MRAQSKAFSWAGWIIAGLIGFLMIFSATMKFLKPPEVAQQMSKFAYPEESMFWIGIVEVACVVLFLIPRTTVLGAVLLTGYLGGAIATHVRVQDAFLMPVILGVLVWLSVYLREPRLRALLPLRGRVEA
jgi:hypothetical protein